jgi:hypothetical protein
MQEGILPRDVWPIGMYPRTCYTSPDADSLMELSYYFSSSSIVTDVISGKSTTAKKSNMPVIVLSINQAF